MHICSYMQNQTQKSKWLTILTLVFAGEMIFSLPFHVVRVFRPTVLEIFHLTNTELGDIFAIYGIMAMIAYFPGGTIADRFSARKLMSVSLLATALGGLYFAGIPNKQGLMVLFGFWGITTIFLFWAAMIKATRNWGGQMSQGKAFGLLDGGRGLMAAITATLAVFILSSFIPNSASTDLAKETQGLKMIIYFYSFLTLLSALLVWIFIGDAKAPTSSGKTDLWKQLKKVLGNHLVWLQAIIVISAYSAYKGLDYFSLYAVDVLNMSKVDAAFFMSNSSYIRVISAIAAGFIVDKLSASKVISVLFGTLIISYSILAYMLPTASTLTMIYANIIFTFMAVFGLRGVYFALLEETKTAANLTGTAVGLISVIGYTPDAFFNSITGRILDANPGAKGHQNFYLLLAAFSVLGFVATLALLYLRKKGSTALQNKS